MDDNRWVDERLSSLDPPNGWRPDSSTAFARLRRREAPTHRRWWLWATLSATAATGCAVLLLVSAPSACANPLGCSQSAQTERLRPTPSPSAVATAVPAPAVHAPAAHKADGALPERERGASYKESGSPTAPVNCEVYADYECQHCANFFLDTMPQIAARYVETGKVRLTHRDFPLSSHRYARLAALYADAAGEAGYYRAVVDKLYRTQAVWSGDGNIDGQVATVVPAAAMGKVRTEIRDDSPAAKSIAADEALAREKHVDRTPTLLCNGQAIGPELSLQQIEVQLDPLVGQVR